MQKPVSFHAYDWLTAGIAATLFGGTVLALLFATPDHYRQTIVRPPSPPPPVIVCGIGPPPNQSPTPVAAPIPGRIDLACLPAGSRVEIHWTNSGCFHRVEHLMVIDEATSGTVEVSDLKTHWEGNGSSWTEVTGTRRVAIRAEDLLAFDAGAESIRGGAGKGGCTTSITAQLRLFLATQRTPISMETLTDSSCEGILPVLFAPGATAS